MIIEISKCIITKDYIGHYNHVNHARYLDIFENAQKIFLDKRNIGFSNIQKEYNMRFVQRAFDIEFILPLCLEDKITIETSVPSIGSTSFLFTQHIIKNGRITTKATTVYVAISAKNMKVEIPNDIKFLLVT